MNRKINLLDCTLRDGGYVNNWEFNTENALKIINGIYESGIRNIEIGIMGRNGKPGVQTKFTSFEQIAPLLAERKNDCSYYVMINQAESDIYDIPECSAKTPDSIRIAFFKPEYKSAIRYADILKQKGYRVFFQTMATFLYSELELKELVAEVNILKPYAMYMVDSFGTLYNEDIERMSGIIASELSEDINFGIHAHNNIQMAFSNSVRFIECTKNRNIYVDGSIYGMGRGAGNAPSELLMHYMNKNHNTDYDIQKIILTYEECIKCDYEKYGWGYNGNYFATALYECNSAWGWYFGSHGLTDMGMFLTAVSLIPRDKAYTLVPEIADEIIESVKGDRHE